MDSIDLISFLRDFYGIANSSLHFNILTHEDIKILFPFIKIVCYKKNIDEIKKNNIIAVYDKTKRIFYYVNPHLYIDEKSDDISTNVDLNNYINIEDINNLSKDELLHLRRRLRKNGEKDESIKVTKLIREKKKEEPIEFRIKKEKMLIKERNKYD